MLIHRRGDHDQAGVAHGVLGRVGHGVAPRLLAEFQAHLGPSCPEHDPGGGAVGARRARDGTAEQAGSEDGEGEGHDSLQRPNGSGVERGSGRSGPPWHGSHDR